MGRRKRKGPEEGLIGSATHDGRGIVAAEGKKVFVAGALAGETVRFQRRKVRRNYDEAELLEVLEASEERMQPRCEAFGRCGGCALQHVSPERQRDIKFIPRNGKRNVRLAAFTDVLDDHVHGDFLRRDS